MTSFSHFFCPEGHFLRYPSFNAHLQLADVWLCGRSVGGSSGPLWHRVGSLNCLESWILLKLPRRSTNALLPYTPSAPETPNCVHLLDRHQILCNVLISKNLYSSWQQRPQHADVVFCHVTIINTGTMSHFIFYRGSDECWMQSKVTPLIFFCICI